jgi:ribosomal protein L37AE/L43A
MAAKEAGIAGVFGDRLRCRGRQRSIEGSNRNKRRLSRCGSPRAKNDRESINQKVIS